MPQQHIGLRERALETAITRAWNAEQQGKLAVAGSMAERILREYPENTGARFVQARIWARTGQISRAIPVFQRLLQEDPSFDAARLALVGTLFLVNEYNEGIDHVRFLIGQCIDDKETPPEAVAVLQSLWDSYRDRDEESGEFETQGKDRN